ncbi:MAG: threonine synthase [Deltaproteobacteria bacterium]|nr:threonine synthase [Deltaproteobacteria bacterium]
MTDFTLHCPACLSDHSPGPERYVCPRCGGNLEVRYDYEALKNALSRERLAADRDPTVWRYRAILPVQTPYKGLPLGGTPLVEAPNLAADLGVARALVKDDTRLPSGSFKDRASSVGLLRALDLGHTLVTGASTGNAASSTATLSVPLGLQARIFIPQAAPPAKVAQLLAFGAQVIAVEGTYDDAFDLSLAATAHYGWYNRNTGYNPYTREGKKTVSFEIAEQLGWLVPDLVAVPVGDGNILTGVAKGFEELVRLGLIERAPRLLAVQAAGSDAIVRALEGDGVIRPVSGDTVADSISVSLPRDGDLTVRAVRASGGWGIRVSDEEILAAIPYLARRVGVFAEPAGVTATAGLLAAARQGLLDPSWTVAALATGTGLKDIASVRRAPVGDVITVAPSLDALQRALA